MAQLSKRVLAIEESATLKMAQLVRELKTQGKDVISLTLGEPDFFEPEVVKEAAIAAIKNNQVSHYTPVAGIQSLREKISEYHRQKDSVWYSPEEIAVFTGAKFALYATFQTLLDVGDEVIVPTPYWVSYTEQIQLSGGTVVFAPTDDKTDFKVTVEQLEELYTAKTKVLILNSPCNPTGSVYSKQELEAIGQWAVEHDIFIVSDEIYAELVFSGEQFVSIASLSPTVRQHSIVINGLSKSTAMTGWRVGYVLAPKEIIKAMLTFTTHTTGNITAVSQYAAVAALDVAAQNDKENMRQLFEKRAEVFYPLMQAIPGFECKKPTATFYLFVNAKQASQDCGYQTVEDFCMALVEHAGVAGVAGVNFGANDFIRFSFATNEETLIEAARRIDTFIRKNKQQ